MGVNQFSDMTEEEFEEIYSGNEIMEEETLFNETTSSHLDDSTNIQEYDTNWYTPKIPVKDQGSCASCFT